VSDCGVVGLLGSRISVVGGNSENLHKTLEAGKWKMSIESAGETERAMINGCDFIFPFGISFLYCFSYYLHS